MIRSYQGCVSKLGACFKVKGVDTPLSEEMIASFLVQFMTAHTSYLTQSQSKVKLGKKKHEIHPDYKCQVTMNLINFHLFHSNDACGFCSLKSFSNASSGFGMPLQTRLSGLDGGMWQSMLECGRKNGSADLHIGCNWQKRLDGAGRCKLMRVFLTTGATAKASGAEEKAGSWGGDLSGVIRRSWAARALAASGVWHGRENEDHDLLLRCMWSLHRCTYLLFVLVHMSGLTQLESGEFLFFWIMFGWVSSDILECWSACFLDSLGPNTPWYERVCGHV